MTDKITTTDAVAITGLAIATGTAVYIVASQNPPEPPPKSTEPPTTLTLAPKNS